MDFNEGLEELLGEEHISPPPSQGLRILNISSSYFEESDDALGKACMAGYKQWTTSDGVIFLPAANTSDELVPGVYDIKLSERIGVFFEKIPVKTDGLIEFPNTTFQKIIKEIHKFWKLESIFHDFNMSYKRGLLLWGSPGGGKSSLIQIIIRDIIEKKNGVVFNFSNPELFKEGLRVFRKIQPNTPIIILMEDIDSILTNYSETSVLNILDGVELIHNCIFLATTNYPEKLGGRIINRPSRFDKRFKIGFLDEACRKMYFEKSIPPHIFEASKIDIDKWVKDTENFSIAHLKELVIAVIILGDDYDEAIATLKSMKEMPSSQNDGKGLGFGRR